MDFPILEICDDELGETWLCQHFHPHGLRCPECDASVKQARVFGHTRRSRVTRYRCRRCQTVYTVYTGTVFANKQLRPAQVILLLRGCVRASPRRACRVSWVWPTTRFITCDKICKPTPSDYNPIPRYRMK